MRIGSEAHKELFCRTFEEGHRVYEPKELPWPALEGEALELLRSLPFWTHALQFEADAGPMISAAAERISDPIIREAMELQAFEERRHAGLVGHMIQRYGLPYEESHVQVVKDPVAEFIDFGFEECLDSFGAFGLFKLARDSRLFPDDLFEIFENVMREESHHIVFFINWFAHREASRSTGARVLRLPRSMWHYGKALLKIGDLVRNDGADDGADFIVTGAQAFVDDLTPRRVVETCLAENERRMASFDRRLIVPRLVPALAQGAAAGLKLVPRRKPNSTPSGGQSTSDGPRETPRAA